MFDECRSVVYSYAILRGAVGVPQSERLMKLNKIAIQQMKVLEDVVDRKLLK